MGKIDIPRVRRHVRTLRHEAHVAQVAVIDDVPEDLAVERGDFPGVGCVDPIEERRKCVAEAEAAATAVTDVEYPLELTGERVGVVEGFAAPVERMPRGCLQTPFASARSRQESP